MEARNANYAAIVRHLQFRKRAWLGLHLADACDEDRQLRSGYDSDSDASEAAEGLEDAEQANHACLVRSNAHGITKKGNSACGAA